MKLTKKQRETLYRAYPYGVAGEYRYACPKCGSAFTFLNEGLNLDEDEA